MRELAATMRAQADALEATAKALRTQADALEGGSGRDVVRHDVLASEIGITGREAAALVRRAPGAKRVGRHWFARRSALEVLLAGAPATESKARRVSAVDRDLADLGFAGSTRR